jgi:hypothetical protein
MLTLRKKAFRLAVAAWCSLVLPPDTLACSPIKAHPVFFEFNSSKISSTQLQALSTWAEWLKKEYPVRELIETEVKVEIGERDRIQLGWQRELAVRLALIDLDFTAPEFNPSEQIWVEPPRPPGSAGGIPSRSVWIHFLPDCPHECPCQSH